VLVAVVHLLDRPTYLYAEVDRLVGLRSGTARRWINGYDRAGKHYEPILRIAPADTEWATWGEFVEARLLSEFRDQSVPTARLRAAVDTLRDRFQVAYPLAYLKPYLAADAGELAIRDNEDRDSTLAVIRTGQLILDSGRPVINAATLTSDVHGDGGYAAEIPIDPEFPGIKVNPDRLSGQPTFEGRRVAISTVLSLLSAKERPADIAADYNLSLDQIDSARRYAAKHKLAV
jgi:uncharacterized protein (DUF433 family)